MPIPPDHGHSEDDRHPGHSLPSPLLDLFNALPGAALLLTGGGVPCAINPQARQLLRVPAGQPLDGQSAASLLSAVGEGARDLLAQAVADIANGSAKAATRAVPFVAEAGSASGSASGHFDSDAEGPLHVRVAPCGGAFLLMTFAVVGSVAERDRHLGTVAQLSRGIVHDVNNTLNPVMAAAYLLDHHAESPEQVREYAGRIRQAADMGADRASRLGRFLRQKPLASHEIARVDLTRVVSDVLDLAEQLMQPRAHGPGAIHLSRRLSPVMVPGVHDDLRLAVLNLVMNAIDAMPDGGQLTVRTRMDGEGALISVRDSGEGMGPAAQARLFEPYFTTKGSESLGLGLAEVYGIVRRHGGHVRVESKQGHGTTVTLRFPATEGVGAGDGDRVTPAESAPRRILLVEDHDEGRQLLERALVRAGHTVETLTSCADAVERLASTAESLYDVLLTDLGLPDGSGWEVVKQARRCAPAIRIGVLTGWEPDVDPAISAQADFLLRKPISVASLLALIAGSPIARTS